MIGPSFAAACRRLRRGTESGLFAACRFRRNSRDLGRFRQGRRDASAHPEDDPRHLGGQPREHHRDGAPLGLAQERRPALPVACLLLFNAGERIFLRCQTRQSTKGKVCLVRGERPSPCRGADRQSVGRVWGHPGEDLEMPAFVLSPHKAQVCTFFPWRCTTKG